MNNILSFYFVLQQKADALSRRLLLFRQARAVTKKDFLAASLYLLFLVLQLYQQIVPTIMGHLSTFYVTVTGPTCSVAQQERVLRWE
jgi:hypothetical protein